MGISSWLKKRKNTIKMKDYVLCFNSELPPLSRKNVDGIILHCSGTDGVHDIHSIHSWHLANGWKGFGYHFFVDADGMVYIGRPLNKMGSHCHEENWHTIGICLEGRQNFTEKQVKTTRLLIDFVIQELGKESLIVKPHRFWDVVNRGKDAPDLKKCPGFNVVSLVLDGELKIDPLSTSWIRRVARKEKIKADIF